MGLFVTVEQDSSAAVSSNRRLFEGELVATKSAPITDFVLTDLRHQGKFAEIADYSQWTESGMVLLLRLLSVSNPIPDLAEPAAGNIVVALRDGATAWGGRELLYVDTHPGWLEVSLICLETLVYAKAVGAANPGLTVQDTIRKALAGVWGHCLRAVPRPLSSVPVRRTRRGQERVLLRDVPTLPRHYLTLYLSLSGRRKLVTGTEWRSFMQRLASERDLPSVGVLM
jgi:hypothetical protein